jgi:endonuclease YncB( thermonuclease family)
VQLKWVRVYDGEETMGAVEEEKVNRRGLRLNVDRRLKLAGIAVIGVGLVLAGVMLGRVTKQSEPGAMGLNEEVAEKGEAGTMEGGENGGEGGEVLGSQLYPVVKVVDGDTIDVEVNGKKQRIRLIGIDAPEVHNPDTPVECFGAEATQEAEAALKGARVRLEADSSQDDKDKYDRWLRFVWLEGGENFNLQMIEGGYAREYTYDKVYKYQTEFKAAEQEAKLNKRGLWGEVCDGGEKQLLTVTPAKVTPTTGVTIKAPTTPLPTTEEAKEITEDAGGGKFTCDCSRTCGEMSSCEEAYFQLNNCGCNKRDGDKDGVPCNSLCQ